MHAGRISLFLGFIRTAQLAETDHSDSRLLSHGVQLHGDLRHLLIAGCPGIRRRDHLQIIHKDHSVVPGEAVALNIPDTHAGSVDLLYREILEPAEGLHDVVPIGIVKQVALHLPHRDPGLLGDNAVGQLLIACLHGEESDAVRLPEGECHLRGQGCLANAWLCSDYDKVASLEIEPLPQLRESEVKELRLFICGMSVAELGEGLLQGDALPLLAGGQLRVHGVDQLPGSVQITRELHLCGCLPDPVHASSLLEHGRIILCVSGHDADGDRSLNQFRVGIAAQLLDDGEPVDRRIPVEEHLHSCEHSAESFVGEVRPLQDGEHDTGSLPVVHDRADNLVFQLGPFLARFNRGRSPPDPEPSRRNSHPDRQHSPARPPSIGCSGMWQHGECQCRAPTLPRTSGA